MRDGERMEFKKYMKKRTQLSLLLTFPPEAIDFLIEKHTISEITNHILPDKTRIIHWLTMLERNGLARSELVTVTEPTETKKGRMERVFWATEECIRLNTRLLAILEG